MLGILLSYLFRNALLKFKGTLKSLTALAWYQLLRLVID